ncbi:MAG TPA: tRNA (guanosine(37)-N1)-methyltransferase TrmD, partial [Devosia sp.]|nr:tRNA (guanosine(37)-N1)-methyltransferase TrmD [Devosia sp.]
MFKTHIITLFPELFPGPLGASVLGRGLDEKRWSLETVPLRSFGAGRHSNVDDTPAGGGPGMVLRADVLARAIDSISPPADPRPRLLMSPRGTPLDQEMARKLSREPGLV